MNKIIIVLSFFIFSACMAIGPLKMYSGPDLSEDMTINIAIPTGIWIYQIDGIGWGEFGNYPRNDLFSSENRDRQVTLLPGQHTIEFSFTHPPFSFGSNIPKKGETIKVSFEGKAGHKYRLAFEALSCSIDKVNMAVMMQELDNDAVWKQLVNTRSEFGIYGYGVLPRYVRKINKDTVLSDNEKYGYIIFTSINNTSLNSITHSRITTMLEIVPLESLNFIKSVRSIGSYTSYLGFPFSIPEEISTHIFELPVGIYSTIRFRSMEGGTIMFGSYCSKFEVLPNKYIYLGRIEIGNLLEDDKSINNNNYMVKIKKVIVTVNNNINEDIAVINKYYPQLLSDQLIVNILTPDNNHKTSNNQMQ
ncbi:MAG: hypothetical protein HY753_02520 [Nitrospirae bacterium]|nr:hypothetical protein [Nitrospirota bacterium]